MAKAEALFKRHSQAFVDAMEVLRPKMDSLAVDVRDVMVEEIGTIYAACIIAEAISNSLEESEDGSIK